MRAIFQGFDEDFQDSIVSRSFVILPLTITVSLDARRLVRKPTEDSSSVRKRVDGRRQLLICLSAGARAFTLSSSGVSGAVTK